jgi:hypothetical protein
MFHTRKTRMHQLAQCLQAVILTALSVSTLMWMLIALS